MRMQPLEPRRVRHPRGAYGWVDLKVVTGGVLERIGSEAAFTYLFLCAVGNMQGVSCWSVGRTARLLGLPLDRVEAAIQKLAAADLIARNGGVIQVLPLESIVAGSIKVNQLSPAMVTATPGSTDIDDVEVGEEEVQVHEPEARRRLSKMTLRPSPASVRRVAKALAIEARRNRCG